MAILSRTISVSMALSCEGDVQFTDMNQAKNVIASPCIGGLLIREAAMVRSFISTNNQHSTSSLSPICVQIADIILCITFVSS